MIFFRFYQEDWREFNVKKFKGWTLMRETLNKVEKIWNNPAVIPKNHNNLIKYHLIKFWSYLGILDILVFNLKCPLLGKK